MERLWTKPYILLTLAMLFLFTGFYVLLPTLPHYVKELGGSETDVGLAAGVFTLAAVLFRPLAGAWADRYGRLPVALLGLIGFVVSMALYDIVKGIAALMALRFIHGVFWSLSTTAIGTLVTDVVPSSRRGEGMGWFGLAITLAMAIGPMAGTRIWEQFSFRHLFLAAAVLSVVPLLLTLVARVPFRRKEEKERLRLFDQSLLSVTAVIFLMTVSYGGVTTFVPLFAPQVGADPGMFFLVYAVALTAVRPVAGRLADRLGEGAVIVPALAVTVAGLFVLYLAGGEAGVLVSAALYGFGFGAAQPALQAAALRIARPDRRGLATASFMIAFDLGIGIGSILLGWVSQFAGYPAVFASGGGFVAAALLVFAAWVRRRLSLPASAEASGHTGAPR